jgi:hypothetical protein
MNLHFDFSASLNTAIGIAVFLEDADIYNNAMSLFQETVPSVIYLESDGSLPHAARGQSSSASALKARWFNQQSWGNPGQNGQIQVGRIPSSRASLTPATRKRAEI